jgi:hypothetical protein
VAAAPDAILSKKELLALKGLAIYMTKREAAVASAVAFRFRKKIKNLKKKIENLEERLRASSVAPTSSDPPFQPTFDPPPFDPSVCQEVDWEGEPPGQDFYESVARALSLPSVPPDPPLTHPDLPPFSAPSADPPSPLSALKPVKIKKDKTVSFSKEISFLGEGAVTSPHLPITHPHTTHQPITPPPPPPKASVPPMPQAFVNHFALARGFDLGEDDGPLILFGDEAQACEETWASNHPYWETILHTADKRKKKKKRSSN